MPEGLKLLLSSKRSNGGVIFARIIGD